jgi:SPP1 family predicted phage head-tail adaptor
MPTTTINEKRTRIGLQGPTGPPIPDADGGHTQGYADLDPPGAQASIAPATARNLERSAAGSTLALATHLITIWYRPDVTTKTRVSIPPARLLNVLSVTDPAGDQRELALVCTEIAP